MVVVSWCVCFAEARIRIGNANEFASTNYIVIFIVLASRTPTAQLHRLPICSSTRARQKIAKMVSVKDFEVFQLRYKA